MMSQYIGLFIGIEEYRDAKFPRVGHAVDDATGVRQAFIDLGSHEDRLTLLTNGDCTYSRLTSAIKRLCKLAVEDDVVVIFVAGHGLNQGGKNYIICSDTEHDFVSSSAIAQDFIEAELKKCVSTRKMVFIDSCHSGVAITQGLRDGESGFAVEDLKYLARDVQYLAVFSSCMDDEKSLTDFRRKHGVWTYFLIEALSGRVPKLYEQDLLFSDKLQAYLKAQTRERTYEISTTKAVQTPVLFAAQNDRFPVADLSVLMQQLSLRASRIGIPITEALLIRREDELLNRLPGYNPFSHYSPRPGSAEGLKFVKKLGAPLVEAELVRIRELLKTGLGYTRKDMPGEVAVVDGSGTLSTKDFDYTISIEHSSIDRDKYVLVHTIHNLRSLQLLNDEKFNRVFDRIEELEIELDHELVVRDIIDALEAISNPPFTLRYDNLDFAFCEVTFAETGHSIVIGETSIVFKPHIRTSSDKIVLGYQASMGVLQGPAGLSLLGP